MQETLEGGNPLRDEMLAAVVRRALENTEFRQELFSDPDAALDAHGFALEDEEMNELREIASRPAGEAEGLLEKLARRFGVDPEAT